MLLLITLLLLVLLVLVLAHHPMEKERQRQWRSVAGPLPTSAQGSSNENKERSGRLVLALGVGRSVGRPGRRVLDPIQSN